MLTAAIEVWSRIGHVPGEIGARNTRGSVYRRIGDHDSARDDHEAALRLASDHGLLSGAITARALLGAAAVEQGDLGRAESLLTEALAESTTLADRWNMGQTQRFLGYLHEVHKHWDLALNAYGSAVEAWRALSAPVEEIEATAGMARCLLSQGVAVGAYGLIEGVLEHLGQRGPARLDEPLRVYWTVFQVLTVMQQRDSAREMLDLAHQMMDRQAAGLDERQRARFIDGVTINRAIRAAWQNNPSLNPSP
jgi:tetratricopeptide (TPR) repeat protein